MREGGQVARTEESLFFCGVYVARMKRRHLSALFCEENVVRLDLAHGYRVRESEGQLGATRKSPGTQ